MALKMKLCILCLMTVTCFAEKELWNDQADILLDYFSIGYRASNTTDIPIMDIKNKSMSISGVRLGDISTLKRLSDVVLEITPVGDTRISGVFGLEKFELKITSVRAINYSGPAIVTAKNNSADISYSVKNPDRPHSCKTKWEKFRLGEFSDIKVIVPGNLSITNQPDVTEDFNKRILPALNEEFNTPEFLVKFSKTFDFCTYKRYLFPLG